MLAKRHVMLPAGSRRAAPRTRQQQAAAPDGLQPAWVRVEGGVYRPCTHLMACSPPEISPQNSARPRQAMMMSKTAHPLQCVRNASVI